MSSTLTSTAAAYRATSARAFVNAFNTAYATKHMAFEEQFWGTKMALASDSYSTTQLASTKKELEDFLSNEGLVNKAREWRDSLGSTTSTSATENETENEEAKILDVILRTTQTLPAEAKLIREATNQIESELEHKRNNMKLGYTDPSTKEFKELSSVGLRNILRTDPSEEVRKAAYDEGLRSIGPFVCDHGFCDIVKKRNQLARAMGHVDYYDYTVTNAEGFDKDALFEILDTLERGTRPLMEAARVELKRQHGEAALQPWNTSFFMAGSVLAQMDPYFPFSKAVERYMRSYAKMGINYQGATLTLDLLDRPHKYSNGFCHWPVPAWKLPDGTWQPSCANFTSLANPSAMGSGLTALTTLMHEAGHAAHFANIQQPSPLFSQERAPTSVAYAELQSMFLDSLVSDASWRAKYALDATSTKVIPFDVMESEITATHPFAVFQLRSMLCVSYYEKALYELPDDEVTPERMQALADEIELQYQGGLSPRPLLSIPHLISDEASCYYQGYTLAELAVHQTRDFLLKRDGYIVDNPNVGPTLQDAYWKCGNARPFLELVEELTGAPLTGDAWTNSLKETVDDKIAAERRDYDKATATPSEDMTEEALQATLNMVVRFVDGDTVISDSREVGLLGACRAFEEFCAARIAATDGGDAKN
jgi:oligoendopeptidase F